REYYQKCHLYFNYFIENGILERLNYLNKGDRNGTCNRYRLSEELRSLLNTVEGIPETAVISMMESKLRDKIYEERMINKMVENQCSHLTKWLNPELQIDYAAA